MSVVGTAMCAVSVAANAYAVKKIKKDDLTEKKIPIMGVMGAFVFAAQMINFTIPATGSSGHIGEGAQEGVDLVHYIDRARLHYTVDIAVHRG